MISDQDSATIARTCSSAGENGREVPVPGSMAQQRGYAFSNTEALNLEIPAPGGPGQTGAGGVPNDTQRTRPVMDGGRRSSIRVSAKSGLDEPALDSSPDNQDLEQDEMPRIEAGIHVISEQEHIELTSREEEERERDQHGSSQTLHRRRVTEADATDSHSEGGGSLQLGRQDLESGADQSDAENTKSFAARRPELSLQPRHIVITPKKRAPTHDSDLAAMDVKPRAFATRRKKAPHHQAPKNCLRIPGTNPRWPIQERAGDREQAENQSMTTIFMHSPRHRPDPTMPDSLKRLD